MLGEVLRARGKYEDSEKLLLETLGFLEERFGTTHYKLAKNQLYLAYLWRDRDQIVKARQAASKALAIWHEAVGPNEPMVSRVLAVLAELDMKNGDFEAAESRLDRAREIQIQRLADGHVERAGVYSLLAQLGELTGRPGFEEYDRRAKKITREARQTIGSTD